MQLTGVNLSCIQHVSFSFTLHLLTIHLIKHHISSTFFAIINVLHLIVVFFLALSCNRSFKNLWPCILTSICPTDEKSDKSVFFIQADRRFDLLPSQIFTYFDTDDEYFNVSWLKNAVNSPFLICVEVYNVCNCENKFRWDFMSFECPADCDCLLVFEVLIIAGLY